MNVWKNSILHQITKIILISFALIAAFPVQKYFQAHAILGIGDRATMCDFVKENTDKHSECLECIDKGSAWTAIGCINVKSPAAFTGSLINLGIAIGGGIAFLLILFGGFQVMTSAGNPDQLEAGKELVSAALAGLLMIIFSVFLLRIIGVDILGLPGFS